MMWPGGDAPDVRHDCNPPHGKVGKVWMCPVCRREWIAEEGGSSSKTPDVEAIVLGFRMRCVDGVIRSFGSME